MKRLPIVTTRDPRLSLWTSLAESQLKKKHPELTLAQIRSLPMMRGIYAHILESQGKDTGDLTPDIKASAEKSKEFFGKSSDVLLNALKTGKRPRNMTLATDETRDYSDADSEWVVLGFEWLAQIEVKLPESEAWYMQVLDIIAAGGVEAAAVAGWAFTRESVQYIEKNIITETYRSWTSQSYSDISWKLPNDAKVVMLGDWGTSLDDAKQLVKAVWQEYPTIDAFVHLGDIYYSGTEDECRDNFLGVISAVATDLGKNMPPIFTIPGNHEYYSFGNGFFWMLDNMNQGTYKAYDRNGNDISSQCKQSASYFRLQTTDGKWQFLGMDTGQDDNNPAVTHFWPICPMLMGDQSSTGELAWHQNKLDNFSGQTILMSHHQLFTRSNNIIDKYVQPYFNGYLYGYFAKYFNKIAAWFWGHEHSFALYQAGIYGLAKGRLLGASSYETAVSDDIYDNEYPLTPYDQTLYPLRAYAPGVVDTPSSSEGFYDHVCAVFDFSRVHSSDPIQVNYYAFPSWGQDESKPTNAALNLVQTESIGASNMPAINWVGNQKIDSQSGLSDIQCKGTPALASNGSTVHMVYRTDSDNDTLHYATASTTSNSATWSDDSGLNGATNNSPGCCVDSSGNLWVFFSEKNSDSSKNNRLRYFQIDSHGNQSDITTIKNNSDYLMVDSAIAATWMNSHLYVAYREDGTGKVRVLIYDGSSWTIGYASGNPVTSTGPGLAANGGTLYLVYADANNSNHLAWQTYTSSGGWISKGAINNGVASTADKSMPKAHGNISLVCEYGGNITAVYQGRDQVIDWLTYNPSTQLWWGGVALPRVNGNAEPPLTHNSAGACALSNGIYLCFSGESKTDIRWARRIESY